VQRADNRLGWLGVVVCVPPGGNVSIAASGVGADRGLKMTNASTKAMPVAAMTSGSAVASSAELNGIGNIVELAAMNTGARRRMA
jgi:hypothetical protein